MWEMGQARYAGKNMIGYFVDTSRKSLGHKVKKKFAPFRLPHPCTKKVAEAQNFPNLSQKK